MVESDRKMGSEVSKILRVTRAVSILYDFYFWPGSPIMALFPFTGSIFDILRLLLAPTLPS